MKKMRVLGKTVKILTSRGMLRKFGETFDYLVDRENNTLYIHNGLIEMEIKRYNGHINEKEAAEDVYRWVRNIEYKKTRYEALRDTIPKSRMKS